MAIADTAEHYARAMGPMQFVPEAWQRFDVDAHHDGLVSSDNIDDAALAAAAQYLCAGGGDLQTAEGWSTALWLYNHAKLNAQAVRA